MLAPDALISPGWLAERLRSEPAGALKDDTSLRVLAVHAEPGHYERGHVSGAHPIDLDRDLRAADACDVISRTALMAALSRRGIGPETTVVLYDDADGRLACYALWALMLRGHAHTALLDGGLRAWQRGNHPVRTGTAPVVLPVRYAFPVRPAPIRAMRQDVFDHLRRGGAFVDARTPAEYSGVLTNDPDAPQHGILRGGHLPGARSIPHGHALRPDDSFKDRAALKALYQQGHGLDPKAPVIVYSRAGPRACLTWFALTHRLGFRRVRVYDGSWAEWGNLVGVPVARDASK